jgi:hypothetical protein
VLIYCVSLHVDMRRLLQCIHNINAAAKPKLFKGFWNRVDAEIVQDVKKCIGRATMLPHASYSSISRLREISGGTWSWGSRLSNSLNKPTFVSSFKQEFAREGSCFGCLDLPNCVEGKTIVSAFQDHTPHSSSSCSPVNMTYT